MNEVKVHKLHVPEVNEIAELLQHGLKENFSYVNVEVSECPNLKEKPFCLAAEGLCGSPRLADVGGVPYLIPIAQNKVYSLKTVADQVRIPSALVIGAGAGPRHYVGVNCEMMANVKFGESYTNNTHFAKIKQDGDYALEKISGTTDFCLLGNLYISEGRPGKVIKVCTKKRIGSKNFVSAMRAILSEHYGEKAVGMGGVFLIQRGKAKLHIMPDYSKTPLVTEDDVNKWLKFFNMNAPLVCLSTFVTHDPGLDIRVEHTHCFSDHGEGGHYHEDVTPDEVEYLGYLNVAEYLFRIDKPSVTVNIGQD